MNRESVLINFVRENMRLLQQNPFPEDLYKKTKHDYFYSKKDQLGKATDSEIAQTALFYLIRKHLLKDSDSLGKLLELPFFKKNVLKPEMFYDALRLKSPESFVVIEPSKLDEVEYIQKVEDEIRQKLLVENQSIFDEQRAQVFE